MAASIENREAAEEKCGFHVSWEHLLQSCYSWQNCLKTVPWGYWSPSHASPTPLRNAYKGREQFPTPLTRGTALLMFSTWAFMGDLICLSAGRMDKGKPNEILVLLFKFGSTPHLVKDEQIRRESWIHHIGKTHLFKQAHTIGNSPGGMFMCGSHFVQVLAKPFQVWRIWSRSKGYLLSILLIMIYRQTQRLKNLLGDARVSRSNDEIWTQAAWFWDMKWPHRQAGEKKHMEALMVGRDCWHPVAWT